MKLPNLLLVSILLITSYCTSAQSKKFTYGVCGHPLTQEAYANNLGLQLQLIKNLKCSFYRVDLPVDAVGSVVNADKFATLLQQSRRNGIQILPVLVFSNEARTYSSPDEAYKKGLLYGTNFAKRYKTYFTYYEIGNEEDNNLILPQVHGTTVAQFDTVKAKTLMSYFRGVCAGIKKEDVSAKLIINHGWVHWGFLDLLVQYNVNYDIIGSHWYSDMGNLDSAPNNFGNILSKLNKKYKKPIWITEFNIRNGAPMTLTKTNDAWLARNLRTIRRSQLVRAVFIYELLDEPAFGNKQSAYQNLGEATYGLSAWRTTGYTQVQPKQLFDRYKTFISKNP